MHHHKDSRPIETITKIRNILMEVSLIPVENWHNYIDGLYSLRLTIPGISSTIGVNGKGVSRELALASAYGELMERLQNQLLYPLFMYYDFDEELRQYCGFEIDPLEMSIPTEQVLDGIPSDIIKNLTDDPDSFLDSYGAEENNEVVCLPYYNVKTGKVIYFPKDSFFYYYGSNGMAAGNTIEESVVQALSEIFERHVMRLALYENKSFPEIQKLVLSRIFPSEAAIIKTIEDKTGFSIRVIDCSMDSKFPVVGIIVANSTTHKHFVKFGAHPDLHIALERCLTELLQGRNITEHNNMIDFKFLAESSNGKEHINFHNIFRDGWGYYPNNLFLKKSDFEINEQFIGIRRTSNRDSLNALLQIIEREKLQLLIRNVGFMGFPAVSVIIPGLSEVSRINKDNVRSLKQARETATILKSIANFDPDKKEKIIAMAKYQGVMEITPDLIKLINLPIDRNHPFAKITTTLLSSIIHRSMGKLNETRQLIDLYLEQMNNELTQDAKSYFRCARNYLILKEESVNNEDAAEILSAFFKSETVNKVIMEFSDDSYLLNELGILKCPDCENCPINNQCSYTVIKRLHLRLKKKMSENPIDQNLLSKVFQPISDKHGESFFSRGK